MNSPNPLYTHSFEQSDSTLGRLLAVLNYRADQRCADLTPLMERANRKELQAFFPVLVDSLFGPQGTQSWSLRNIDPQNSSIEYDAISLFLKPLGPVFKMIYSLLMDVNIKYEFGLNYLPLKVRQMLETQNISPFYSEVLQYHPQTKQPISLLLNPYDYYIFHFAYHLINPCHQRKTSDDQWNSVYYNLSAEYLLHFFPTELDCPILPYITYYQGKNPLQLSVAYQRPPKHISLLKNNVFTNTPPVDVNTMHQMMDKHPRNDIWRSETILIAFVDFWLSNDQVCLHYENLNMSTFHELPSADYIRIIRVVIKHMHAFASTSKIDNSALGELKNITLPMIQTRMYVFLRNLLYCWPLDETFRLVLELWLSFIQPWRYSHDQYNYRGGIHKTSSTNLSNQETKYATEEYLQFIAENLLVYIVIFQQLLPRFARIDLASPKNSQMLFRLTKVFNQPNLVALIKQIECIVENKNYSPSHTFNSSFAANLPPLSPTTKWCTNTVDRIYDSTHIESPKKMTSGYIVHDYDNLAGKFLTTVRQKIYELEGPNFCYKPLFTQRAATEVYELLQMIKVAELKSFSIFIERKKEESSAFSFLTMFTTCSIMDKVPLLDRQKAPLFLRSAADNLVEIFNIEDFNNFDVTPEMTMISNANSCSPNEKSFPCVLTPSRVRERAKTIKYTGDPELIPIRTYENKLLVRACYELSKKINDAWGPHIHSLYESKGFRGRLARAFIHGPILAHKFEKRNGYSNRVSYIIPPRISLRKYADQKFLLFLFIGSLITYIFNYGGTTFTLLYILFSLFCGLMRAVFFGSHAHYIDLNDSMEE